MNKKKPTYISLFSSAGVGCYGFKINDFDCIATVELIERRINVQTYNQKCKYSSGYICGDITLDNIKASLFHEIEKWKKYENLREVDVVIATPPCQGMSVANHKKSNDEIIRNSLVIESIKAIKSINPKFFIFENVAGFMKTACTDVDGEIKTIGEAVDNTLVDSYSIHSQIINFKNYGACSSRTRTLVIGVRNDLSDFLAPIEIMPDYIEETTLRDNISSMKSLNDFGEIDPDDIYHSFRVYPEHMRSWVSNLSEGQSAFDNIDPLKIPHCIVNGEIVYNQRKNGDKYRRQIWDKVGPCIHTRNDQFASQNTIHPSDDRVFSIRELMRLMTIPDDFKWVETSIDELNKLTENQKKSFLKKEEIKIRQSIGEAVPTIIFENIARKINRFLSKNNLNTVEIRKCIDRFDLNETFNLHNFINENPMNLGVGTLARIAEITNSKRSQNAAFFTNKSLANDVLLNTPDFNGDIIRILEPSVGVGNFIPLLARKYQNIKDVYLDVVDIDPDVITLLKLLVKKMDLPHNIHMNYICDDFLTHNFSNKYDLVIGNPPFSKLNPNDKLLGEYRKDVFNSITTNTFSFFLEKAIRIGRYVSMITPKFILNTPEFKLTRDLLERLRINSIIDFGEKGFKGVLVETIALIIDTENKPGKTKVFSKTYKKSFNQKQQYICDAKFPYWIIFRDERFDFLSQKMMFDIFTAFRDRQITNKMLVDKGEIRVIKSRNIAEDGSCINDIPKYDAYISSIEARTLSVFKYIDRDDVYLTPNMTYKPRVIKKPKGMIVNGSVAILTLKDKQLPLTENELKFFSSDEYREFYRTARNYQTRSLNIDSSSVYFFGRSNKGGL